MWFSGEANRLCVSPRLNLLRGEDRKKFEGLKKHLLVECLSQYPFLQTTASLLKRVGRARNLV